MQDHRLARTLGLFSVGLGLTETLATDHVAQYFGLKDQTTLLRLFGLREIATGIGLLAQSQKAPWLWARVLGDVMDLALLGSALKTRSARRGRVAAALGSVAVISIIDALGGSRLSAA